MHARLPDWPPFPEVPAALEEARARGWRLAILSNTDPDLIEASKARLGVTFDETIVASAIGSYKPGHRHWQEFFLQTGAERDRHVHVAASLYHDVAPARELGLRSVWVNRLGERAEPEPTRRDRRPDVASGCAGRARAGVRLPRGYSSRPVTRSDATAIASVVNSCEAAYVPEPVRVGELEVGRWLERAIAAIVVSNEAGEIVGCTRIVFRGEAVLSDGAVLPGETGRGIGSFLLDWSEREAHRKRGRIFRVSTLAGDEAARRLVVERGFAYVRSFYRMVIDLGAPPPRARWPAGSPPLLSREGEERILHEVVEESFAEHWGHVPQGFDQWRRNVLLEPEVTVSRSSEEMPSPARSSATRTASVCVGRHVSECERPGAAAGLGRALLLQGFGELYAKSKRRIGLGVDAGNETGAVRLYESAGMRVGGQEDVYEKRS